MSSHRLRGVQILYYWPPFACAEAGLPVPVPIVRKNSCEQSISVLPEIHLISSRGSCGRSGKVFPKVTRCGP